MSEHEPAREDLEPAGGFQPSPRPEDLASPEERPDWLVGADDGLAASSRPESAPRPTLLRPSGGPAPSPAPEPPAGVRPAGAGASTPTKDAGVPEPAAWAPAASSVPKLTVVSRRERVVREDFGAEDPSSPRPDSARGPVLDEEDEEEAVAAPQEPWWLVAVETLATNRLLQIGLGLVLVLGLAWTFWPRKENATVAIAAIKQHPQRFEGQSVRIRGEVGEVFDVGSGVVFELHQRRDTLVVFSPSRRPSLHDRLLVQGTVSTGYLDGTPRVALFEAPGAATP